MKVKRISIDRLNLRVRNTPSVSATRQMASSLGESVLQHMLNENKALSGSTRINSLQVGTLQVKKGASNKDIHNSIAKAVSHAVNDTSSRKANRP